MDIPSPSLRKLAERLLSLEAESNSATAQAHEAVRVCEKLRVSLTRFAGPEGFASLLRRSLALARADTPSLDAVTIKPDGSLEGLEALVSNSQEGGPEAVVGIIAHLLGLLVTFIGEPLTLRLVREAWPNASVGE
jgi:hypothetical protein